MSTDLRNHHLASTLGSLEWMRQNEDALKALFAPGVTLIDPDFLVRFGLRLKLLGVEWRTEDELQKVLIFLSKAKLIDYHPQMRLARPRHGRVYPQ